MCICSGLAFPLLMTLTTGGACASLRMAAWLPRKRGGTGALLLVLLVLLVLVFLLLLLALQAQHLLQLLLCLLCAHAPAPWLSLRQMSRTQLQQRV